MTENILVVEYEPRYTDRVRQALAGQPFTPTFAKDGEEAIRALDSQPKLIVLSSVVPKVSANEIIRAIRDRKTLEGTPILLTVSGYTGNAPKQDAARMGASDILPKPYSETDFLGKVRQMLGSVPEATQQLTSNEIFGDLTDDNLVHPTAKKSASSEADRLVEETLAGMLPRRKDTASRPVTPPSGKTSPGTGGDFDKKLQDTLSGLEKSARKVTSPGTAAVPPAAAPPATAPRPVTPPAAVRPPQPVAPAPSKPVAAPVAAKPAAAAAVAPAMTASPVAAVEKVPLSQPVIPPPAPAVEKKEEEEEPTDGIRFGQYVLLDKIATGGMAEVWKARMRGVEGFQKIVAIKKILPHLSDNQDFIEMFVDEAKLAAQLNHNNIIHIYDLGKIGNSYYIAMEFVDGHDLKTILRRGADRDQPMNVELALFIASKIAAALDYAHRKRDFDEKEMGLVHRDVSPQNVLISQEGDIKLCDFGIAKAASKASHTQAGALKGKLQYMSPEQAWGKNIDRRSDIFALATVLFEMLTNRKLFTGENEMSILEQVREARVTPPSLLNDEVTPEIDRIVLKALQKEPENRYQTAGEMARDIDSVLYSFRPTPTSADLAIYMHRIWVEQAPHQQPRIEEEPPAVVDNAPDLAKSAPRRAGAAVPVAAAAAAHAATAMPAWEAPAASPVVEEKKRSAVLPIAAAAVVVLAAAGGYFFFSRRSSAPVAAPATSSVAAAPATSVAPPVTNTALTATTTTATTSAVPATGTAAQVPALDPTLVAQEVQKRLAAERAKLEQQNRTQQTATTAPAPVRPAPVTASQAPPPTQTTATVAPPPVTETHAATATQAPAVDTAPAAPHYREGDLVPSGTEGLVLPRMQRRATVGYPPMARAQRVQGTVLLSVLVSETGQVLDTRIIKGIPRGVGLNEAAQEIMRRSTFSPPTKDGVRVKAWTTERVDFKL